MQEQQPDEPWPEQHTAAVPEHPVPPPEEGEPSEAPEVSRDSETADETDSAEAHADDEEGLPPQPRIWVGSWLDYNHGVLHGDWIAADRDAEEIEQDIQAMLARSPTARQTGEAAEDWGIFDFDGFGRLRLAEQDDLGWVCAVARGIAQHGLAFAAYADVMQEADALDSFDENYLGHFESAEAYAEQLMEDLGYDELLNRAVPESLRPYVRIDTAVLAQDMQFSGEMHVIAAEDGGVWVFRA